MDDAAPVRSKLRAFFKSNYTRYLEGECIRIRLEKDSRIRELIAEKLELVAKVDRLEMAIIPGYRRVLEGRPAERAHSSTLEVPAQIGNFAQALEEHNQKQEEEWRRQKNSGPAVVEK